MNTTTQPCQLQPNATCTTQAPRDQLDLLDRAQLIKPDVYGVAICGVIAIWALVKYGRRLMGLSSDTLAKTVKAQAVAARANEATIRAGMQVRS